METKEKYPYKVYGSKDKGYDPDEKFDCNCETLIEAKEIAQLLKDDNYYEYLIIDISIQID